MAEGDRDPLLLTPGPLTTADSTKRAMLHDWGTSRRFTSCSAGADT
jgi:aspartate aminotransferase-like enzyme